MRDTCKLCGQTANLVESHFVCQCCENSFGPYDDYGVTFVKRSNIVTLTSFAVVTWLLFGIITSG